MKCFSKALLASLIIMHFMSMIVHGQTNQSPNDTTFKMFMSQAWDEIRDTNEDGQFSDSLQNKYAIEFLQYYLNHSTTEVGIEAGWQAFMMWSNTSNATEVDKAISKLGDDSELYSRIIHYIKNVYYQSEEKGKKAYFNLLKQFKKRLAHPNSRSAVYFHLGDYYLSKNQIEKAQNHYREVLNLDANSFFVDQAIGNLYEIESLQIGEPAPGFSVKSVQGKEITLSDYQGKIVLLEFWATWCGPCIPEIPHLKSLQSKYEDGEFEIIGIALNEDPDDVITFIKERNMGWAQILQPESWKDDISEKYNVSGIPRSYIIGRDGKIVGKDLRGKELENEIATLMNN